MALLLNEDECEKIVRKASKCEDVKIIKFDVESFGNFYGFLGEYFLLKIQSSTGNFDFFLKSLSIKNVKQRKMLVESGIFKKEVKLYENLILNLTEIRGSEDSWCPRGYFFRDDLLVLDDLSLMGYKMLPFRFKFDKPHVEATLKTLANFHCCSVVYEEIEGKSIGTEFRDILFETSVDDISWFHSGIQTIFDVAVKKTKFSKSRHIDAIRSTLYEKLFGIINNMETSPYPCLKVLSHRDVWKNNLMFKFRAENDVNMPTHCVLLDFQTARYLPVSIDVLMAITCTTRRDHYEKFFDHYLNFYYQELEKNLKMFNIELKAKMSYENFLQTCEHHKTFGLVYSAMVNIITMIPQDFFAKFDDDMYRDFADGNRSRFILELMEQDSSYKECLVEAVEAAVEFLYQIS